MSGGKSAQKTKKNNMSLLSRIGGELSTTTFYIEYGGYLTNHLSHGIIALHRLGASEARIDQFISKQV